MEVMKFLFFTILAPFAAARGKEEVLIANEKKKKEDSFTTGKYV
jgi:hypothetical protein